MVEYDKIPGNAQDAVEMVYDQVFSQDPIVTKANGDYIADGQMDMKGTRYDNPSSFMVNSIGDVSQATVRFPVLSAEDWEESDAEEVLRQAKRSVGNIAGTIRPRVWTWNVHDSSEMSNHVDGLILTHYEMENVPAEQAVDVVVKAMELFKEKFGEERPDYIMDDPLIV